MNRHWLIDMRQKYKKSQSFIAVNTGVSRQYYGMIESGARNPSVELAKKIASVLYFEWTLFFC